MLCTARFVVAYVALIALAPLSAMASTTVSWTFNGGGNTVYSTPIASNQGSGTSVQVSGWADTATGGTLAQQTLKEWAGLAVDRNGNEQVPFHATSNARDYYSPTYDSGLVREMILFNFSSAVTLNQMQNGWAGGVSGDYTGGNFNGNPADSDMTVLACVDTSLCNGNIAGQSYSQLMTSGGWALVGSYANTGDAAVAINASNISSSYWLIGAYNSLVDNQKWTDGNDFVKLMNVAGYKTPTTSPSPGGGVPEPASLLLLAGGLPLIRRFNRSAGRRRVTRGLSFAA